MKLNTCVVLGLAIVNVAFASVGHCNLVEDGSAFTGTFKVQEDLCKKEFFNWVTGKTEIIDTFNFKGTPEGLIDDGRLMTIQKGDIANAQPNSGGTVDAAYVSPTEFYSREVVHMENSGIPADLSSLDYMIDEQGNLTVTHSRIVASPTAPIDNTVCHFVRVK